MRSHWYMMSGYAYYVWSAYGLVLGCLMIAVMRAKYRRKKMYQQLKQWFKEVH